MNYFLRLNVVSVLYAFMVFVPLELMLNVYRISRITNWEMSTVTTLSGIISLVEIVAGTILLYLLTNKWLNGRKGNYWTVILWVPYFVLFVYSFATLFPVTYGGDYPNPGSGLIAIGGLILYPLYILLINFVGMSGDDESVSHPV
ncbi:hypothetical protein [Cytobacillus gottheilii]|uniref:Uncharacterized protein n=1 Tax=Cytobacillus gottheilii TaxID=859144 RepID=A0ABX8FHL9_9BACI|nr:hypothetical protein [Cytobacillus gottheilii]QVY63473.1 hypothetical protein J1899_10670 [Cytobacillus gottheilii]